MPFKCPVCGIEDDYCAFNFYAHKQGSMGVVRGGNPCEMETLLLCPNLHVLFRNADGELEVVKREIEEPYMGHDGLPAQS